MKRKVNLVIDNQYFPNNNWFKTSYEFNSIYLLPYEPYKKMSFRNRAVICGSNGLINLSVPVEKGRNQKASFRDIKISYHENWQMIHWRSLVSCYSKSPFFSYYEFELSRFFQKQYVFLFDMNVEILNWLRQITKLPAEISIIENELLEFDAEIVNMSDMFLPKNFQEAEPIIRYPQVFEDRVGFQSNLSILDMLFNVGPETGKILSAEKKRF